MLEREGRAAELTGGVSGKEDREGAGGGIGALEAVGNGDEDLEIGAKGAGEGEELARARRGAPWLTVVAIPSITWKTTRAWSTLPDSHFAVPLQRKQQRIRVTGRRIRVTGPSWAVAEVDAIT